MTKDEALKMAIEALETAEIQSEYDGLSNLIFKAIQACKDALEQPAQEPCVNKDEPKRCWRVRCHLGKECVDDELSFRKHPAQEPMACDGKFPENFDASLNIPAQYLRLANGIMMDYMGKRLWDVPMCATAIMEFITTHPAPSWQGLSDDEINDIKTKAIIGAKGMSVEQLLRLIVSLTEQASKEKNNGSDVG